MQLREADVAQPTDQQCKTDTWSRLGFLSTNLGNIEALWSGWPTLTTAELSDFNYRMVHRIYSLLREWMVELAITEAKRFAGDVEVDESYFGTRRVRIEKRSGGKFPFWASTNGEIGC